jgi:GGDEF domain-containing protein
MLNWDRLRRAAARLTGTDHRTGLADARRFRQASHRALARGVRDGRYSAVLVVELHGAVQNGAPENDALVAFAALLRRCVPAPGLPCRLDPDTFAVVLSGLGSADRAYDVAGRIAAEVSPVVAGGRLIALAAGIGVAVSAPGELGHDELLRRAGMAMLQASKLAPQTRWAAWQDSYGPLAAAA